jgi:GntR family transcriptional regulator, transcriptional repressor for pyruvate dehydrogenase complex
LFVKSRAKISQEETTFSAYRPQYEIVAEKIVEFISDTGLQPGDRLPTEQKLGEQLGVSRGIVREAIKSLAATGLVAARKGVGVYVAGRPHLIAMPTLHLSMTVDPEHIQALFNFRCMQEMLTARLATERITLAELRDLEKTLLDNRRYAEAENWDLFIESDDAFHRSIAQAAHNPFLVETIIDVLYLQRWAIKIMTGGAPGSLLQSVEQHEAIFNAIKDGQGEEAAQLAQTHIDSVLSAYRLAVRRRLLTDDILDQS